MTDSAAPLARSCAPAARPADPFAAAAPVAADAAADESFETAIRRLAAPRVERPDGDRERAPENAQQADDQAAPKSLGAPVFASDPFIAALMARLGAQEAPARETAQTVPNASPSDRATPPAAMAAMTAATTVVVAATDDRAPPKAPAPAEEAATSETSPPASPTPAAVHAPMAAPHSPPAEFKAATNEATPSTASPPARTSASLDEIGLASRLRAGERETAPPAIEPGRLSASPAPAAAPSAPVARTAGADHPTPGKTPLPIEETASPQAAPSFGAVAVEAQGTTRHLPPARIEAAAASFGEAALSARPDLLDAPDRAPPSTSLRLALTPAGLGEIEVTLRLRAGRLEAAIAADRPETAALVENRRGELTDALRRAGYDVDPGAVATRGRAFDAPASTARGEASGREDGRGEGERAFNDQGAPDRRESQSRRDGRGEAADDARREARARATRPDFLLGALP